MQKKYQRKRFFEEKTRSEKSSDWESGLFIGREKQEVFWNRNGRWRGKNERAAKNMSNGFTKPTIGRKAIGLLRVGDSGGGQKSKRRENYPNKGKRQKGCRIRKRSTKDGHRDENEAIMGWALWTGQGRKKWCPQLATPASGQ